MKITSSIYIFAISFALLGLQSQPAIAVEKLAGLESIKPPLGLDFASLINVTDTFGAEIQAQGQDILLVTPESGGATHYSLQLGQFTNIFDDSSDIIRSSYHYAPEAIYRFSTSSLDVIDRVSGKITSQSNPLGSPDATVLHGKVMAAMLNTSGTVNQSVIKGYDTVGGTILYEKKPSQSGYGFLAMKQDGFRAYAISRNKAGTSFGELVSETYLECFDINTGNPIFETPISLAYVQLQSAPRLNIIPFAVGYGVVAIGDVEQFVLLDSFTGENLGAIPLNGRVRTHSQANGYSLRTSKNGMLNGQICGNIALGEKRIYLQNEAATGATTQSPGISVFSFDRFASLQVSHLFDIPNPYLAAGESVVNDFGGEMDLVADKLIIGNRRFVREDMGGVSRMDAAPRVFIASFTSIDQQIFPSTRNAYLSQQSFEISENNNLVFDVVLNRPAREDVLIRVSPVRTTNSSVPTATPGVDFSDSFIDLTFSPGETIKSVTVPIYDDDEFEENEIFTIVLNSRSGNCQSGQPTTTVTLISDEAGSLDFMKITDLDARSIYPNGQLGDIVAGDDFIAVSITNEDEVLLYETEYFTRFATVTPVGSETDTFGLTLDSSGDLLAIGHPGASAGTGEVQIHRITPGASQILLATVIPPVASGGVIEDFAEIVRIQGDLLAVSGIFKAGGVGGAGQGRVYIYQENPANSSDWQFVTALEAPQTQNADRTISNSFFAEDLDFGPAHLVVLHPSSRNVLMPTSEGAQGLVPTRSDVHLFDLADLAAAPLTINRANASEDIARNGDAVRANAQDFVWVDGKTSGQTLIRYSYSGSELSSETRAAPPAGSGDRIADLAYNGSLALRAPATTTRKLNATYVADGTTVDYDLGLPSSVYQPPTAIGLGLRDGLDTRGGNSTSSLQGGANVTGPVVFTNYCFDLNSDFLVVGDRASGLSQIQVFQTPSPVRVSILPGAINEGANLTSSRGNVTFNLTGASINPVEIFFETVSDTAIVRTEDGPASTEYDVFTQRGSLIIPPGQTSGQAEIQLEVDTELEGQEAFQVLITAVKGAGFLDRISTIAVIDDETDAVLPSVSIADATFDESQILTGVVSNGQSVVNDGELTLTLSAAYTKDVVVTFSIESAEATFSQRIRQLGVGVLAEPGLFGKDYTTPRYGRDNNGDFAPDVQDPSFAYSVRIPAGDTTAAIEIPIADDSEPELPETVIVRLLSVTNAKFGAQSVATLTLTDNDPASATPLQIQKATGSATNFGRSIDTSGGTLVASKPATEIVLSGLSGENQSILAPPFPGTTFGIDAAIEGNYVLTGDIRQDDDNQIGTAYLFNISNNSVRTLAPTTPLFFFFPRFGSVVEMASSGSTTAALTGSQNDRKVYIFDAATGNELRVITDPGANSFSLSLSASGSEVLVGSFGNGAYLYDWTDGTLVHHFANSGYGTGFGANIHLSDTLVLIGHNNANTSTSPTGKGAIAVYDKSSFNLLFELTPPVSNESNFGKAVTVAGSLIAVSGDTGTHLFSRTNGGFVETLPDIPQAMASSTDYLYLSANNEIKRYEVSAILAGGAIGFERWKILNARLGTSNPAAVLPPFLAYNLGLNDQSPPSILAAANPKIGTPAEINFQVEVPVEMPPNARLEVLESANLVDWNPIATRESGEAWVFLRPSKLLSGSTADRLSLEIDAQSDSEPKRFLRLGAAQLED